LKTSSISKNVIFVLLTVIICSVSPAFAQVTFTNDEVQFLADNPGLAFQDFNNGFITPGSFEICLNPVNSESNDPCFTPGFISPILEFLSSASAGPLLFGQDFNNNGNPPNVLETAANSSRFEIVFLVPEVSVVGMQLGCLETSGMPNSQCNEDIGVDVFGTGDVLLASTTVPGTSLFDTFLGVESSAEITRIRINVLQPDNASFSEGLLNIRFGANLSQNIPTLSEAGLIVTVVGLMLVGVFFAVKRRKAATGT